MFSDKFSLRGWRKRTLFAAAALCLLSLPSLAAPDASKELEQRLKDQLDNRTLRLRQPYVGKKLQFDAEGKLQTPAEPGGWAGDGYFQIHGVRVRDNSLTLFGNRLAGFYDRQGRWQLVRKEEELRLEFTFPPGALNEAAAQSALAKVFRKASHAQPQRPPPDLGNFRNERLEIRLEPAGQSGQSGQFRLLGSSDWKPLRDSRDVIDLGELEDGQKLYAVTKAVQVPRPVETVDPEFGEEARREKRNGAVTMRVIVNDAGRIHSMQVESADTLEFAMQAAKAVSRWKFEPAKLEGLPVAVIAIVTVNFRIYP